jgi:glucokinase
MTKSIGMLVAGEIGPTRTQLALCGLDMGAPVVVVEETLTNGEFAGVGPMVHRFLTKHRPPRIRGAAFVVPGPIDEGVCLAANLPWPVEAEAIGAEVGIDRVSVLNEVGAIAHAIQTLARGDLLVVSDGAPSEGNQVILSAGDYPGMAGLYWNGTEHCPFVSEGGHADFAPSNEGEARLAVDLATHVTRVTVELLLSRSGLVLIYRHLRAEAAADEPKRLRDALQGEDAATVIIREGTTGADPVCRRALEMFLSIYGSAAGNLALTLRATGGVFLAGGIVPSLRASLVNGAFASAFCDKAPMQGLLGKVPIQAIMNERAAILGAATVAARELRSRRVGGWAS